jgi:hypothetical protein
VLRRLTEEGFASIQPKKEITVPIFSLEGRVARRPQPSQDETWVDY